MRTPCEPPLLGDATFSGREDALDAEAMLARFREHLRPTRGATCEVQACRLSRIRHRKAERCVLQYDLTVSGSGTIGERDVWVSGLMYAEEGKARRTWRKLMATGPEVPETVPVFEPVSYLPDLGMLVYVFPYDRKIPGLGRLVAGPPPALERRLLARFGPGGWTAEHWDVEAVRYRERLSAVLGYTARDPRTGKSVEKRFYTKVYRDDAGESARQLIEDLRTVRSRGFDVVRPVIYMKDSRALVLEEAPGISLEEILCRGRGVAGAPGEVARALADFNQIDASPARRHTLGDQIADLEKAARTLCWACPWLTEDIREVIGAVATRLEEVAPAPAHLDSKPDHFFLYRNRVTFIDLDSFAAADPVIDPALLLARLVATPHLLPVPRDTAMLAARAFAHEYFARVPASWRGRLHLHYSGAAIVVASGFFRRQEQNWLETVLALVDEAKKAVEGRGSMMELLNLGHHV